jgi:hypothetical protein
MLNVTRLQSVRTIKNTDKDVYNGAIFRKVGRIR